VLLDKDLVLPVLRALQCRPEAARLWEEHISAMPKDIGFQNTAHEKNIYTGQFRGEKALLVRQVDDFALGCRQESTAESVYCNIGTKLTLHNKAEAPFEHLGLVDSFDGYNVLHTLDYIKLSAEVHGWDNPHHASRQINQSLLCIKAMLLICSIWQQVWLRTLPNTKLLKSNKVLDTGVSSERFSLPTCLVVLTLATR